MRASLIALVIFVVTAGIVLAGRPVTQEERTRLVAALAAEGCSGGKMIMFEDPVYEVDEAACKDGKKYDFEFDASFKVTKKSLVQ